MATAVLSSTERVTNTTSSAVDPVVSLKFVHTIILDSSPLLLNTPPLSTLLAQSHSLVTLPSVISEIRDPAARSRVETLYLPLVTVRSPKPESVNFVREFARKTGDAAVLSNTDIEVLALAYDLECERNGGDWRLRRVPGQKRVNGNPPVREEPVKVEEQDTAPPKLKKVVDIENVTRDLQGASLREAPAFSELLAEPDTPDEDFPNDATPSAEVLDQTPTSSPDSDSDSEGWITPSNIAKHQAQDESSSTSTKLEVRTLQVGTMTGDFAMQNVLLQMNLNLLSPKTCKRIAHLKQTILRCHGCFATTKQMDKQFCPRCGKPTLTRVSCTTNDKGEVKLHLKANMQWNNRGNVFAIPKATSGTSNQKWKSPRQGGGQKGWGNGLILAEDQKEYVRAMTEGGRSRGREKNLMDEDYLPSILTGDRNRAGGRVKVGAGRNVNARKRQ